jgi:hypothetical protein
LGAVSAAFTGCLTTAAPPFAEEEHDAASAADARHSAVFGNNPDGAMPDVAEQSTSTILPVFGTTVTAANPPPPISGGTLLVTANQAYAIAADPDRDLVYGVVLGTHKLAYTVTLQAGDEPGRIAEDGSGRVHVALRGSGGLVTLDEATGAVLARRFACPTPRGVAWDSTTDLVWVACATGELVGLPSAGGAATTSWVVERDLRDVIVKSGSLTVSELRSADVLRLASDGTIARRDSVAFTAASTFASHVAWRATSDPWGDVVVVHQLEALGPVSTVVQGGYGGPCGSDVVWDPPMAPVSGDGGASDAASACPTSLLTNFSKITSCNEMPGSVVSALTVVAPDGTAIANLAFPAALPVDVAVSHDGSTFAVVAAGNTFVATLPNVIWMTPCGAVVASTSVGNDAQPTALAFESTGALVVQTREPAALWFFESPTTPPTSLSLSATSRDDTGHDVFHAQAGAMIACASCHPEGGDDGHVWMLDGAPRRSPSLRGTIQGTAPYHWPGDMPTFDALATNVYATRMDGQILTPGELGVLQHWVEAIPPPVAPSWVDLASASRGQTLFDDPTVGCSTCHSGAKLTNNQTVDVGTGGAFQVPPLIGVGWRTPLLHDGCAATIADRFGSCATSGHGQLGGLTSANITDLGTYLETL